MITARRTPWISTTTTTTTSTLQRYHYASCDLYLSIALSFEKFVLASHHPMCEFPKLKGTWSTGMEVWEHVVLFMDVTLAAQIISRSLTLSS
ncbi:hypothetical protein BRADI_2g02621v3 [Brachypodium distachyon]|uniref:Uncharacterized protein n=1 Tax=Brachypodium distachyon TaxID=15368 RepID=A0A0Q3QMC1_BRADI|nr:hypothetical protein BRADI_2g02621v3 [Brachypodium distachyon]